MAFKSNWPTTSRHERGYGSSWDKVRLFVLRRDNGLCQCDQCKGGKLRLTLATEVHHRVSKADAKRKGWTQAQMDHPSNLAAINSECHKRETLAEQGKTLRPKVTIGADGYPV
jgi:5-methylcytosine-specific restriction protein A